MYKYKVLIEALKKCVIILPFGLMGNCAASYQKFHIFKSIYDYICVGIYSILRNHPNIWFTACLIFVDNFNAPNWKVHTHIYKYSIENVIFHFDVNSAKCFADSPAYQLPYLVHTRKGVSTPNHVLRSIIGFSNWQNPIAANVWSYKRIVKVKEMLPCGQRLVKLRLIGLMGKSC